MEIQTCLHILDELLSREAKKSWQHFHTQEPLFSKAY